VTVPAEDIVYRNTSYTVRVEDELGIFDVNSIYFYDGNYSVQNCSFWVYKDIGELFASVNVIPLTIQPGDSKTYYPPLKLRLFRACDNTTVQMDTSSGEPGNWTSFNPEKVFLLPVGEGETNITVTVPMDADYGVYYGWIFANAYGGVFHRNVSINLTVIVAPVNFYLKTTIPPDKKEVCQGSDVYAEVNVTKFIPGQVEVNMTYQILYNGTVLAETKETLTLNDILNSTIRIPILTVPSDAALDYHTFLSILQHNETWLESSDTFKVKYCITPPPTPGPGPGVPTPGPPPAPVKKLLLNLSTNLLSVVTGNRTSFVATVENVGTQAIESVKISIEGIPSGWIKVIPNIIDIPVDGTQGYLVIINVPSDAETGVYQLKVKATDDVESNTEILTLIIGENLKEIADLLLKEFEDAKLMADQSLLIEDCLDITIIKTIHKDALYAHQRALEEYDKGDYAKAINWLEYAIPLEHKVISRVDINLEMELRASNASKIIIPPFYESEGQFSQAHIYFEGKKYEEICDPIEEIRKFIMVGLIFWPIIVIIIVLLVIIFVIFYKRKRKEKRAGIMERVRERLGKPTKTT